MSEESVEIVRRGPEAWSRGDLGATLSLMDPQLEWRTTGLVPGVALAYHGHEGYTRFWQDFRALWDEIEIAPRMSDPRRAIHWQTPAPFPTARPTWL